MTFTVIQADGDRVEFGDAASYSFNQAGFLVVVDDTGKRLTFSHVAWRHVEDVPRSGW